MVNKTAISYKKPETDEIGKTGNSFIKKNAERPVTGQSGFFSDQVYRTLGLPKINLC